MNVKRKTNNIYILHNDTYLTIFSVKNVVVCGQKAQVQFYRDFSYLNRHDYVFTS